MRTGSNQADINRFGAIRENIAYIGYLQMYVGQFLRNYAKLYS